jgi:hypothetical protein
MTLTYRLMSLLRFPLSELTDSESTMRIDAFLLNVDCLLMPLDEFPDVN